jgi:hypothetical protein
VGLASFNAWSLGIVAVLCLPLGVWSVRAMVVGIALVACAFNEFRGRALVRQMRPRGLRLLGFNQLAIIAVIAAYCAWAIYASLTGPNPYEQAVTENPELASMLGSIADLHATLTWGVYGIIFTVVAIFQGSCARYYFSRVRLLREHVSRTPAWAMQILQLTQ